MNYQLLSITMLPGHMKSMSDAEYSLRDAQTRLKTSTRDIDSSQAVPLEAQKVKFGALEEGVEASF